MIDYYLCIAYKFKNLILHLKMVFLQIKIRLLALLNSLYFLEIDCLLLWIIFSINKLKQYLLGTSYILNIQGLYKIQLMK